MNTKSIIYPAHYRLADDIYQTVEEHVEGVRKLCGQYASNLGFTNTGILMGLLHDMGKFTDDFYNYINESIQREKDGLPKLSSSVDHGKHGALFILEHYHNGDAYRKMMSEIIAIIVCYHHGGMEDFISDDLEIKLIKRTGWPIQKDEANNDYKLVCERFYERIMSLEQIDILFDDAVKELHKFIEQQITLHKLLPAFNVHLLIKYLYSCLIDADRYDTYLFMQKAKEEEAIDIAQLWNAFNAKLIIKEESFQNQITHSELEENIKQLRHDIWKQCKEFSEKPTGIYTLTVPTGGGKTLSSLRYAIDHAIKSKKRRILYVLPFTTIIEQNADTVRKVLDAGDNLLEHHSNAIHEDVNDLDEYHYHKLLTEQWTSPIIFTTMVQFLNTFFARGTQDIRRYHNLTDTIIIFDEIQALPIKCISMFNETVNFLSSQCRDTIILCSATQPNLNKVNHKIAIDSEIITDLSDKFMKFKRMNIIPTGNIKMSQQELGEFVADLKNNNESILVIMNTKKTAESVFNETKLRLNDDKTIFYFLSTNLCPAHRKIIIRDMKEDLKKHKKVICVSTQLIEAGVDISFSCVVRHIAGLDSIAQASGRGNRNGEGTIKDTYVVQLEEERLGSLKEIDLGEKCTSFVFDQYKQNPDRFNHDLLSPQAISCYYDYYFSDHDIERKMDYPIDKDDSTIWSMLTKSNKRAAYKYANNEPYPIQFDFQFRKATINFEVIDEYAKSVLVPFGEGKNIISQLLSKGSPLPDMKLVRSAQQYMVNVSKNVYEKLKENQALVIDERSEILILKDHFYDDKLGVVSEGGYLNPMILGGKR